MNEKFAKLNVLDSNSIYDVRRFSTQYTATDNKDAYVTDYIGHDDIAYADKWPGEHFNYHINDYGFREKEYTSDYPDKIDLGVFGCSFTFGVGLPEDALWHKILSKELNVSSLNFGLPAASIETIVDVFLIMSKHIKMNTAIFLLPSISRLQIAKKHPEGEFVNYLNIIPSYNSSLGEYFGINEDLIYRAIPDEEIYKICKNKIYLLDHIAKERGIKLYLSSWDKTTYDLLKMLDLKSIVLPLWTSQTQEFADSDLARDRKHPGPKHHLLFVDRITNSIKWTT